MRSKYQTLFRVEGLRTPGRRRGGGRDVGPAAALEALSRILAVGTERAARAAKETLEQRARDLELLQVCRGLSSYQLYQTFHLTLLPSLGKLFNLHIPVLGGHPKRIGDNPNPTAPSGLDIHLIRPKGTFACPHPPPIFFTTTGSGQALPPTSPPPPQVSVELSNPLLVIPASPAHGGALTVVRVRNHPPTRPNPPLPATVVLFSSSGLWLCGPSFSRPRIDRPHPPPILHKLPPVTYLFPSQTRRQCFNSMTSFI